MGTDSPFRYALASARRLYLHWTHAKNSNLEKDFGRVIKDFERAVDEIDRLNQVIEGTKK